MRDLISRAAAIEAAIVDVDFEHTDEITFYTRNGKKVVFVKKPHWIPCSERLPEEKKEVLISADGELYIAELETINGERFWSEVVEYRYIWNVDAWMPLPEPWKGKKDDSKSDEQLSYM